MGHSALPVESAQHPYALCQVKRGLEIGDAGGELRIFVLADGARHCASVTPARLVVASEGFEHDGAAIADIDERPRDAGQSIWPEPTKPRLFSLA